MIDDALHVSFACPRNIGVGGTGTCVMLRNHVTRVSPGIFEVHNENLVYFVYCVHGLDERLASENLLDVDSDRFEHFLEDMHC